MNKIITRILCVFPAIFLSGTIILLMFINLSGVPGFKLLHKFYFSTVVDDYLIFWTMYGLCVQKGDEFNCSPPIPAFPYAPAIELRQNVPPGFYDNVNLFFYGLRVGYAMFLLSLIVAFICLIPMAELAYYCRLKGLFAPIISGFGLLFVIVGAVMETVVHLKGCHLFQNNNQTAQLGVAMFICMWVSVLGFMVVFGSVFYGRALAHKQQPIAFYEDKGTDESLESK